jgi:hypothetical protein
LFTFESEETGKNYIAYTDNTYDEEGHLRLYAATYTDVNGEMQLSAIESDVEYEIINNILSDIQGTETEVDETELSDVLENIDLSVTPESFDQWFEEISKLIYSNEAGKMEVALNSIDIRIVQDRDYSNRSKILEFLLSIYESFCSKRKSIEVTLMELGTAAYEEKQCLIAETCFEKLAENGKVDARNNLACLIRKGEISSPNKYSISDAIKLLKTGADNNEPFSIVNMALIFANYLGADSDWKIADDMIKLLPEDAVTPISFWWEEEAVAHNDVDGYLVHLWLLWHKKMMRSNLGDIVSLKKSVKELIDLPEWFAND